MSKASDTGPARCDEALLNAYVDGELPADEAAALAQRAARAPALAARIAALHQMKAGVAMLAGEAPPLPPPGAVRAPRRRWPALAVAGMAAAIASMAVVLAMQFSGAPGGLQSGVSASLVRAVDVVATDAIADAALARHDEWVAGYRSRAGTLPAPGWLEAPMHAAGLRLVHLATVASGSGPDKLHHGFTGTRDCRLSLFEKETPDASHGALHLLLEPALLRAEWQVKGRRYTMLARDMNRERFTAIAAALHDVSGARAPAGAMLLAGLEASRLPCTA